MWGILGIEHRAHVTASVGAEIGTETLFLCDLSQRNRSPLCTKQRAIVLGIDRRHPHAYEDLDRRAAGNPGQGAYLAHHFARSIVAGHQAGQVFGGGQFAISSGHSPLSRQQSGIIKRPAGCLLPVGISSGTLSAHAHYTIANPAHQTRSARLSASVWAAAARRAGQGM